MSLEQRSKIRAGVQARHGTVEERLWSRVNKNGANGCWLWTGPVTSWGYGRFCIDDKRTGTHQVSYRLHKGEIPKGMVVRHSCDTPRCVNPDHLEVGTHQDNTNDKCAKNRQGRAKLKKIPEKTVLLILKRKDQGIKFTLIAQEFGLCLRTIQRIKHVSNADKPKVTE